MALSAELRSFTNNVVSSQYCDILKTLFDTSIPRTLFVSRIFIAKISTTSANSSAEAGQPCWSPRVGVNHCEVCPLTRALLGLWIFHRLLGGGGGRLNAPPWSRLLVAVEKNERQRSKAREKSFRNNFGHFLVQVKIEVTRGQNSKIFQNGFSTIKSLILKVEQRIWYHSVCLVKARRTIYKMTFKGQGQSLTSGQVRPRAHDGRNGSYCISLDSPGQDERTDTNLTSLSLFDKKLLANDGFWPRVTSNDLSRGRQCKFLLELSTTVLYDMIPLK